MALARRTGRRKVTSWEMYRKLKHKLRSSPGKVPVEDLVENWCVSEIFCGPFNDISQGADN